MNLLLSRKKEPIILDMSLKINSNNIFSSSWVKLLGRNIDSSSLMLVIYVNLQSDNCSSEVKVASNF